MPKVEFSEQCPDCGGTGVYIGFGEHDGAAVQCRSCKGTGCYLFSHTYKEFHGRRKDKNVKRVYEVNPGIGIGVGPNQEYALSDFGGMLYKDWLAGKSFPPGSENRRFTCPAWWYQSADYDKKPDCHERMLGNAFSGCARFKDKDICWGKWDSEHMPK